MAGTTRVYVPAIVFPGSRPRLEPDARARREAADRRVRESPDRDAPALPLTGNPGYERALEPSGAPRPAAGIDYLIGEPDLTGRGLGPSMIAQGAADAWTAYPEIVAIVVVVQVDNRPSLRALEKAGYRRVWSGIVDSGDPSDDGPSHVYLLDRPS